MQNKTFRLFISSPFSDFSQERRLLQTYVFPEIKKYCRESEKGYTFQPIDLRWGVSNEAQLDQKALELCIEEVKSSKNQPHPNFLIMAGDRYGWVPTPYAIEQSEFEKIRAYIEKNDSDIEIEYWEYSKQNYKEIYGEDATGKTKSDNRKTTRLELLEQWYKLDENEIPASYILQERKDNRYGNYLIYENWGPEEDALRALLKEAVNHIEIFDEEKEKYFTSATEHEVIEGIFKYLKLTDHQETLKKTYPDYENNDFEHVYGYIRNVKSIEDKAFEHRFKGKDAPQAEVFKKKLQDKIQHKEENCNLLITDANLTELSEDTSNGSLNYTYEAIEGEENSQFVTTMNAFIKRSIDSYDAEDDFTPQELEAYEQERFKEDKLKLFIGREEALKAIHAYIENDNDQPLVIYGPSGMGKSALMAKAIEETKKEKVYRFVGSTATLTSSEQLLISILKAFGIEEQIRQIKDEMEQEKPEPIEEFYLRVQDHLENIEYEKVIFIDAVDQLVNEDEFIWLPSKLPSNLKIIISALEDETYPEDTKYFTALKKRTSNLYKLENFEESEMLIRSILRQYGRSITETQLTYLQTIYKDVNTPLYLMIAAQEIRHWNSEDKTIDVDPHGKKLAATQKGIIAEYIENLTELYHHDDELVKRVLSYLYLTEGVSEAELLELLSTDESFVDKVAPETYHYNVTAKDNITKELPSVIWARLHTQLKAFIKFEEKDGQETMSFFHREFNDNLKYQPDLQMIHEHLIKLLQKLIEQYQDKPFYSNRWGKLYFNSTYDDYSIDYSFENKIKIERYKFFSTLKNKFWVNTYFETYLFPSMKTMLITGYSGMNVHEYQLNSVRAHFYIVYHLKKSDSSWNDLFNTMYNELMLRLHQDYLMSAGYQVQLSAEAYRINKGLFLEEHNTYIQLFLKSFKSLVEEVYDYGEIRAINYFLNMLRVDLNKIKVLNYLSDNDIENLSDEIDRLN